MLGQQGLIQPSPRLLERQALPEFVHEERGRLSKALAFLRIGDPHLGDGQGVS